MMRKTLCRDRSKKTSFQIVFLSFVTLSLLFSSVLILKMWYYPLNYSTLYVNSNLSFNNAHLLQTNLKLQAVQASPNSYRFLQPDGITLTPPLYPHGCHSYHFTTDYLGYTVMDNNETGWKVYGTRNKTSGKLEPTKLKVGLDDPILGQKKGVRRGNVDITAREVTTCCTLGTERSASKNAKLETIVADVKKKFDPPDTYNKLLEFERENPQRKMKQSSKQFSSGTLKNLVVLIRFSDHTQRELPTPQDINILMNKEGGDPSLAPTGSIRDFFLQSSYGQFNVLSTVRPWLTLPNTEKYYADDSSGATIKFEDAIRIALDDIENDKEFSFSDFDMNDDNAVDSIVFLYSGYGAEWGSPDCFNQEQKDRIWSHKWIINPGWMSRSSGIIVDKYHTSSALWSTCENNIARIGTLSHEIGHTIGLPDLYDPLGNGIGSFGIMGNSWGFDGSQLYPPIMSPWSKIEVGWLDPTEIHQNGKYDISASAESADVFIIKRGFPPNEYLLIENRQPIGFDEKLPQGGILVWHIDEMANNVPGYPNQHGWPSNGNHYKVAVLQADRKYDLEKGKNRGDSNDVWHSLSSSSSIRPSTSSSGPYPNTDSYQGGIIKRTGICISDFSTSGSVMSFKVEFIGTQKTILSHTPDPFPKYIPKQEITTPMSGDISGFGSMFDIQSSSENVIVVNTLLFHTRSTNSSLKVKVYTKKGSYVSSPKELWTVVADIIVQGEGFLKRTAIPEENFKEVHILPLKTQAFYVSLESPDLVYSRSDIANVNTPFVSNSDLEVNVGSGVSRDFGSYFPSRRFNGSIKYTIDEKIDKVSSVLHELTTTYAHNNGSFGSMFNVEAFNSITITSMDVHIKAIGFIDIEIWTKRGVYEGYDKKVGAWILHGRIKIEGRGLGIATTIPSSLFTSIVMEKGEKRAFYITLENADMRYTNGLKSVTDENLKISGGLGIGSYSFGKSFYPRSWNGSIKYVLNEKNGSSRASNESSLMTTMKGGSGSYGCQFDIFVKNQITILSIGIHTRTEGAIFVEVYTRIGSHIGYESRQSMWGKPIFQGNVVGMGLNIVTSLPQRSFTPIVVNSGQTQAFYIALKTDDLRYSYGNYLGQIFSSNRDLNVLVGTGIGQNKFEGALFSPRVFNGELYYIH